MMRTCLHCGWAHRAVTRASAEASVAAFNTFFNTLTSEEQQSYYGGKGATITDYARCDFCGGPHTNFRPSKDGDCPEGCTVGPIIYDEGTT